ncbi:transketolase [Nitrosopumilus sp. b2]|uniref:transketolase n=1 Tax=Nitrosopumilus sp. b2 TaxID=2109908 RepID=UPI0015F6736C|nr:transketolase [Nitrosopumilus sp. b2]KAF6245761.1 transketolase [Nitrosopumilus sp. b2]
MENDLKKMDELARRVRIHVLDMVNSAQSSHIGASYSIVEILVALYSKILKINPKEPSKPNRDKFILSKAHGSCALYAVLAESDFFPLDVLKKYYVDGGILPGHLDKESAPGIEHSMGSLGHGLPFGVGLAYANKIDHNEGRIYVLIGDGECNEGTVWESAMFAGHHKLNNLTVIVDYNKIQSFGRVEEVMSLEPFGEKWKSFNWDVHEVDGHDFEQLITSLESESSKPKVIIANTIKGKGVSFMEDKLEWHYKSPNPEQYDEAVKELESKK